jgi:hypothetical protein
MCGMWLMAPTRPSDGSAAVEVVAYTETVRNLFLLFAACAWFVCLKGGLWMWRSAQWDAPSEEERDAGAGRDRAAGSVPPPVAPT